MFCAFTWSESTHPHRPTAAFVDMSLGELFLLKYISGPSNGVLLHCALNNSHQGWLLLSSNRHKNYFLKPGPDTNRTACPCLSVYIVVGLRWVHPISSKVVLITSAYFVLINKSPIYTYATEDNTCFIIDTISNSVPLCMFVLLKS